MRGSKVRDDEWSIRDAHGTPDTVLGIEDAGRGVS